MDGYRCTICGRHQPTSAVDEDGVPRCVDCQARPISLVAYRRHREPASPVTPRLGQTATGALLIFAPRDRPQAP